MMSFTVRSNSGKTIIEANDPETGLRRTGSFNSIEEALEAVKQWEEEANSQITATAIAAS